MQDGEMQNDEAQDRQKSFSDLQVGEVQKKPDGERSVAGDDERPQPSGVLTQRGRKICRPKHLDNFVL